MPRIDKHRALPPTIAPTGVEEDFWGGAGAELLVTAAGCACGVCAGVGGGEGDGGGGEAEFSVTDEFATPAATPPRLYWYLRLPLNGQGG